MKRLALAAGAIGLAWLGWRQLAQVAGAPLMELDEMATIQHDPYIRVLMDGTRRSDLGVVYLSHSAS